MSNPKTCHRTGKLETGSTATIRRTMADPHAPNQHAVLYNLLVIGEASRALTIEVRQQLPEVEWKRIIGLRNILTHEYYSVDLDIIWGIISRRLHELRDQIDRFLSR